MKRPFQTPETALSLALSLVLLAAVAAVATLLPGPAGRAGSSGWLLAALLVAGVAMGMLRPRAGLSLGAAVLAPATLYFGPALGGVLAGSVRAAQWLARPPVERRSGRRAGRRRARLKLGSLLTGSMAAALAGLVASTLWYLLSGAARPAAPGPGLILACALLAGLTQVLSALAVGRLAHWVGAADETLAREVDARLLLDLAGWVLGGVVAVVFASSGVVVGVVVLAVVVLLVAELTRNELALARRARQLATLSEVSAVGHRMTGPQPDVEQVAGRILAECRRLAPAQWLQLEVGDGDDESATWHVDPEGEIVEGPAQPPESPPPIPGVHRRAAWQVLHKDLAVGDRRIATLKLWTDPRQTEWEQIELLDALLPQLATSLGAVLADRKASRDDLTGVATRSVLEERLERAHRLAYAEGTALTVVMCDIDHFKAINDEHGHAVGDRVLQEFATTLESHCRGRDVVCRYGGEEFTILMVGAEGRPAVAAAERLRRATQEIRVRSEGQTIALTASFGVACFPETYVEAGAELVPLADAALYEAKRRGRNRTIRALGHGRFENHQGRELKGHAKTEEIEAPRLFV